MLLHTTHNAKTVISGIQEGDAQPNAVDIRLDRVWGFDAGERFEISEQLKAHALRTELLPDEKGWFVLLPGTYEILFSNRIKVAEGEAGWVITRSTLNRNGVFITSGLYDSGYGQDTEDGAPMAGALHVSIPTRIKKGTRIGQYLIVKAETDGLYDGDYGKGTEHDKHLG